MRNGLAILADRGLVQPGTMIELVPSVCGDVAPGGRADRFRVMVVNPQGGSGALQWPVDGKCYSAQTLLTKLEQEEGVCGIAGVFNNWRIVGHTESISGEANSNGMETDGDNPPHSPSPSEGGPPRTEEVGDRRARLETIKLVLEIAAISLTVVTGLVALLWRFK